MSENARVAAATEAARLYEAAQEHKRISQRHRRKASALMEERAQLLRRAGIDTRQSHQEA